ncbi:MAG: AAA family ATPase [Candidatus Moranbacteria bacterium]|nr:AAA family ATPase [Candidatus Moranbacteria bacterium]
MFVKKIELRGFKSFAQKTVMDFEQSSDQKKGITCIVGPNGSGKSNIADALRWVIGEQSSKSLRGKKEDIIYAGSEKKAKLGSAQVSIHFDNSSGKFRLDYPEVIITRKVFRNGENEYLINSSKVRLTDIIELLSQAGLGQGSYAIINQGMGDRILSAAPGERRLILEDAAGIREFQIKKTRSLKKLEKAADNLEKVNSQIRELEPRLKLLERQKNKIEKCRRLQEELKRKREDYYASRLRQIQQKYEEADSRLKVCQSAIAKEQNLIFQLKNKINQTSGPKNPQHKEVSGLEKEKVQLEEKIYKNRKEISILEGKIEIQNHKLKNAGKEEEITVDKDYTIKKLERIKAGQNKIIGSINRERPLEEIKKEAAGLLSSLDRLIEEISHGKAKKNQEKNKAKSLSNDIEKEKQKHTREKEEKEGEVEKAVSQISKLKNRIIQIQEKEKEDREEELKAKDELRRKEFELEKGFKQKNYLQDKLNELETEKKDVQNKIKHSLGIAAEQLSPPKENTDPEKTSREIDKINWQLEQVSGIDESVVEDYKDNCDRHAFLTQEAQDLKNALSELKKASEEMDKIIKQKFEKAFDSVGRHFNKYFQSIFGGGQAALRKSEFSTPGIEEEEEGEKKLKSVGLEISVSPPGKKISSLNMLSGGERSLTSIALLFAIIAHNPPPFVFLDEIEANLDDANSSRFNQVLNELAGKTQFILATHNKQTMQKASVLYGTAMQDEGYTKVYSLKLQK